MQDHVELSKESHKVILGKKCRQENGLQHSAIKMLEKPEIRQTLTQVSCNSNQ